MPERILVVDDEASIIELVAYNLRRAGYEVLTADNGEEALRLARGAALDLLILDVMLPGMDGFDVLKEVRRSSESLPVLMLTARGEEIDRVVGFEIGADDYVTKPFSPRELMGRVKAILRRAKKAPEPEDDETHTFGTLSINFITYEVAREGQRIDLTPTEYQILKVLAQHPGRVFSRDELVDRVMGPDFFGDVRTVDVHIRHLRAKIEENPSEPRMIETVRGAGYKFTGAKRR